MKIVSRNDWGAQPPRTPLYYPPPGNFTDGIFVHHSVTNTGPDEPALVRGIQGYHQNTNGWKDVAYSWLVGQSGTIYEGRGWGAAGGHTQGYNTSSHAVCFIGNSDTDIPTVEALAAIEQVIVECLARYGMSAPVRPHRAVNQTACPGAYLADWVVHDRPTTPPHTPDPEPEDDMTPAQAEALARIDTLVQQVNHDLGQLKAQVAAVEQLDERVLQRLIRDLPERK